MKSLVTTTILALGLTGGAAFAEGHADLTATGDAAAGEKAFRQCVSCHVVQNDDGETLAGRKSKTGPNLYQVVGRAPGAVEGFRYGKDLASLADSDLVYDEATFVAYVQDPKGWLQEATDNSKARSKMSFKVRKEEDAINLYAYLKSLDPAMADATN
ncbi:c-type cytochrome [Primorskyibacter sp. S187A]|uniref:c-type cytochrome n=1 Tax=Primorskyibacter sp. S187A TaxID=3415130 RepID=UPI003C7A11F1